MKTIKLKTDDEKIELIIHTENEIDIEDNDLDKTILVSDLEVKDERNE